MRLSILLAAVILLSQTFGSLAQKPLTVFAASSMSEAMTQIGAAFEEQTGTPVTFSFAGTGTLARQIEAGAPADVFVSADTLWMDYLVERGAVSNEATTTIASNQLVLIGPKGTPELTLTKEDILKHLQDGRLAIADPDTVPAGRYGKAALVSLGLWQDLEIRLAPMENVRIALASTARGDAPLALVYATDAAIEPDVEVLSVLPSGSHPKIAYPAALAVTSRHPDADPFLKFMKGPEAVKILRSLSFLTDKEE